MADIEYLEDIYFKPSHPASFSGVEKLYQTVKKRVNLKLEGYPVWPHSFVSPSAFSRRAVVSYWRKYVYEVLVNRL